jgi:hypothetical protein
MSLIENALRRTPMAKSETSPVFETGFADG